ncbi:MAG: hypothetical protein KGJ38_02580, partial [Burkholderiaceae bacterium]|nr:hypothetical protein [Burkholderiaceae bacterium]
GVVVLFVHFLTVSPKTLLIFNELRIRRFRASRPFRAKSHGFAAPTCWFGWGRMAYLLRSEYVPSGEYSRWRSRRSDAQVVRRQK